MTTTEVDREYERRLRAMTPMEKMARCAAMLAWTRQQMARRLLKQNPGLTEEEIKWLVAKQLYADEPEVLKLIDKASKRVPG